MKLNQQIIQIIATLFNVIFNVVSFKVLIEVPCQTEKIIVN